jgi:hypothetical protein
MASLVMMWMLVAYLNVHPLWIGVACAVTFFNGRALYRQWQENRVMVQLMTLAAEEMAKKPSQTAVKAPGDEIGPKEG